MKTPKTFYKYRVFDTRTLLSICEDTLYFSNPGDFNDPLDCSPTFHCDSSTEDLKRLLTFFLNWRVSSEVIENIKKAKVNVPDSNIYARNVALNQATSDIREITYASLFGDFEDLDPDISLMNRLMHAITTEINMWYARGVCCFSTSYTSPLLWSHYGNQHQGICIGYSTDRQPTPMPLKVVYGGERAINTSTLCKAFLEGNITALSEVDRDVLLKKAGGWKYEAEWRLIGNQGNQESPMLMTDITFGLRCEPAVMHTVMKALEGRRNKITFYVMTTVGNSFALRRRKFNIQDLGKIYPNDALNAYEAFGGIEQSPTMEEIKRIRGK